MHILDALNLTLYITIRAILRNLFYITVRIFIIMPSPTWEWPLTPPTTAGWKEGETAFVLPEQEEREWAGQPRPQAPVFGPRPLPEPIAYIEVSSESEPEEAESVPPAQTTGRRTPTTPVTTPTSFPSGRRVRTSPHYTPETPLSGHRVRTSPHYATASPPGSRHHPFRGGSRRPRATRWTHPEQHRVSRHPGPGRGSDCQATGR